MHSGGLKRGGTARRCLVIAVAVAALLATHFLLSFVFRSRLDTSHHLPSALGGIFVGPSNLKTEHAISALSASAQQHWSNLLSAQSTTLRQAVKEYRRRYDRDPPRGFDEWFAYAKARGVRLMDEYDGIHRDLEPFWLLDASELRRRSAEVAQQVPGMAVVRLREGKITGSTAKWGDQAKAFAALIHPFQDRLPNAVFVVNEMADGRVLVPWEKMQSYLNITRDERKEAQRRGLSSMIDDFKPEWHASESVWEAFRHTCLPSAPARRLLRAFRQPGTAHSNQVSFPVQRTELPSSSQYLFNVGVPKPDMAFLPVAEHDFSFCDHPWAQVLHEHFSSRARTISSLYPIFSGGKAPGYSDIVIPSYHDLTASDHKSKPRSDADYLAWTDKAARLYWRGSSWRGTRSGSEHGPRERLVHLANDKTNDVNVTLVHPSSSGATSSPWKVWKHASSEPPTMASSTVPLAELNEAIMDIAFTDTLGLSCERASEGGDCDTSIRSGRLRIEQPGKERSEVQNNKFLLDVEGQGSSSQFLTLLEHRGAVVKATVYREWWTDRIQPWLHFIPLSSTFAELYNIYAYFAGVPSSLSLPDQSGNAANGASSGDESLRRIAFAGQNWRDTFARREDMEAYVYRLCLEWARLLSDDREDASFRG